MSELQKLITSSSDNDGVDFETLLISSKKTLDENSELFKRSELNSLLHIFYYSKQYDRLSQIILKLLELKIDFNEAHTLNLILESNLTHNKVANLIEKLSWKDSLLLINRDSSDENVNRLIEKSRLTLFGKQRTLKEDLLEKFEFFRTQHLEEKAKETLDELLESFPSEPSLKKYINTEQEKNYEKVISRTAKKSLKSDELTEKEILSPADLKVRHEWFDLWRDAFGDKNSRLLREQMNFLNFEDDTEIAQSLLELPHLDIWEKVELLHKTKRHYEGLVILDNAESEILAKEPKMVYNFYYYKALLLKGAGLEKEALSILEAIIEQNAGFRDVKYLYKKWQ